jgi:hypothetical protein
VLADLPLLKVNGPSEAEPGQLIVLSAESDGTYFLWIPDASLGQVLQCNPKQIGMATPRVGIHKVVVVASNDKGEMAFTTHVVVIKSLTPVTPIPPTDPVKPVDPVQPIKDFAEFTNLSKKSVATLKDNPTALQLKNALSRVYPELLKLQNVTEAKQMVTKTIQDVLLLRTGTSKDVPWLSGWREPLFLLVEKYKFFTVKEYADSIKATMEGLEVTTNTVCIECMNPSILLLTPMNKK